MSHVKSLKCRECGREYPKEPIYVCEFCFGSLEVNYDYDGIFKELTKEKIQSRPENMWRYRELLPIDGIPIAGLNTGFTPLIRANRLAEELGIKELYIKDDSVNHPTLSFKDRVVAVAATKAIEFGFDTIACASTGNLANSVSAHAAHCGLYAYVFIPTDLEMGKIVGSQVFAPKVIAVEGNYDDVNKLCSEVAAKYKWAFVNINIRPYYAEGSKTYGFELAEQLGWKAPQNIIVPVAGGSLISKIWKGLNELLKLGFIKENPSKIFAAQAKGCSPVVTAIKNNQEVIKPVKPNTIAKSIAIGNPADGYYALDTVHKSGGYGEEATDDEIREGIKLLARTEGIFTETAGGVTMAVTQKLINQGKIKKDESTVICITGNGLKTQEAIINSVGIPDKINANLESFEKTVKRHS